MKPLHYHIYAWKICGIWQWPDQPHWYTKYSFCYCMVIYVIFPFFMSMNLFHAVDIYAIIETLCFLPTGLVGIKLFLLISNKSHIVRILALVKRMERNIKNVQEMQTIRQCEQESRSCIRSLMILYVSASITSYFDVQIAGNKKLMWAMWLPYNFENSKVLYQVALAVQLMISMLECVIHSSLDSFGATVYKLLGAHIDILSQRLEDLAKPRTQIIGEKQTMMEMRKERDTWLRQNELELRDCILVHQQCLAFSRSINIAMSNVFLVQFAMSGATMCGSEFQLSVVSISVKKIFYLQNIFLGFSFDNTPIQINPIEDFPNFVRAAVYIMCSMGQLFLSCYFASQLTHKSEQLIRHIFNCNWTDQSHNFKKTMSFFMQRSMHPIVPKAGGVFEVGLPIFMSVRLWTINLKCYILR